MKRKLLWIVIAIFAVALVGCGVKGSERTIEQAEKILQEALEEGSELYATNATQIAQERIADARRYLEEKKADSALTHAALAVESAKEALSTTKEYKSIPNAAR
ncbi:MAG: hypothetical protein OEM52_14250 [bacterium]|nr:hypothetical protein [bacterium]